jgi:hypothetical protein
MEGKCGIGISFGLVSYMSELYEVNIDYHSDKIPQSVRILRPTVYRDGNSFCCLLGADPQSGIFGCGDTPEDAMDDWDNAYQHLLSIDPRLNSLYSNLKGIQTHWIGWRKKH